MERLWPSQGCWIKERIGAAETGAAVTDDRWQSQRTNRAWTGLPPPQPARDRAVSSPLGLYSGTSCAMIALAPKASP